jgi:hypothetical protein
MNQLSFIAYDNAPRPIGSVSAGNVSFPSEKVWLQKFAGGALLHLGYQINFVQEINVSISNITGEIYFVTPQSSVALGLATNPGNHVINSNYKFPGIGQAQSIINSSLQLPLSSAGVETIEKLRSSSEAKFRITFRGSALVFNKSERSWDACRLEIIPDAIELHVSRDHWIQQVRNVSPIGSVLVEIPLAVQRKAPWEAVWSEVDRAAASLAQGGEAGWESCVMKVRLALEQMIAIDETPEQKKKGRDQNQFQRRTEIAKALYNYCSLWVHADNEKTMCTRADAMLALSTLCALLSSRDP